MSKYDVVIRVEKNTEIWDLDVSDVPVFQADFSAVESGEIGDLFGINSTEIPIPGTKNTNKFFNFLFDLGTTPSIGLKQSVPCQVLVNGQSVFTGRLFVKNIITNGYGDITYNCEVFNPLIDFKSQAEDLLLSEMDWSEYNHTYDGPNIISSWSDGLFNGDIYYPLIDYGKNPRLSGAPFIDYGTISTNGFINDGLFGTGVQVTQFKPSIRLKAVVDKIFDTLGFSYTSSFIDSDYFKNLYYLSTNDDVTWGFASGSFTLAHRNSSDGSQIIIYGNPAEKAHFVRATPNPGLLYNTTSERFVAPVNGTYTVRFVAPVVEANVPIKNTTDGFTIYAYLYVNGASVASVSRNYSPTIPGVGPYITSLTGQWDVELAAGDYVEMYIDVGDNVATGQFLPNGIGVDWGPTGVAGFRMEISSEDNPIGANVDLTAVLQSGETALNFIKGIIHKFNLVMTPISNSQKLFIIEPYIEWIQDGNVVDWTGIVDRNVKWKIEHPLLFNRPKTVIFTDVEDSDYIQQELQIPAGRITYGTYKHVDDGDIAQQDLIIGDYFASTPFNLLNVINQPIPRLYEIETSTDTQKPYKFEHRILHRYREELSIQDAWSFRVDYSGPQQLIIQFPTLIPIGNRNPDQFGDNNWPITYTNNEPDQIDLHFGTYDAPNLPPNNNLSWASGSLLETNTSIGAYKAYWDLYIDSLYNTNARKLTCNVIIKPEMIADIQLNDNVFIDGHYYRIDRMESVDFVEQKSTTVELIKLTKR